MSVQTLSFSQMVKTTPEEAYRAFTNSSVLREWLCDVATVVPRPGGRFYLWWNSGYYTSGEFTAVEPGKNAAFTWRGRGEPTASQVLVTFSPQDGGTFVTLDHSEIGTGEEWAEIIPEIKKGWKNGLENLASVCATGEDLRFVMRPMLGIYVDEFSPEIAKQMGLPISEGIRLSDVVEGMGAKEAGLQADDVIVSMGNIETTDFSSFEKVIGVYRAGDTIDVTFYRGTEKRSAMMKLSGRPIPEIPETAKELSEAVAIHYKEIETSLDEFLVGVSEEEASFKLSPDEWSLKGNLAHFIQGERFFFFYRGELVSGNERFADDYGGNINSMIEATIAAFPTYQDMVLEYKRNMTETLTFLANLPDEFVARKGTYWRLANVLLQDPYHFNSHLEQMQATLDAARKK
jgi:uncharacterized protein YndB with AHSA1/START domain